jgi:hypothetical protein
MMDTNYAQFPYHCSKLEDVFDPQYTESNAFAEVLEIVNNEVRPGHQGMELYPVLPSLLVNAY